MNAGTVQRTRMLWQEIEPELQKGLHQVMVALVDAESIDTIRLLQGKAKAYRDLMRFPETLEQKLPESERAVLPKRGAA